MKLMRHFQKLSQSYNRLGPGYLMKQMFLIWSRCGNVHRLKEYNSRHSVFVFLFRNR
jgi:hypothetical protein